MLKINALNSEDASEAMPSCDINNEYLKWISNSSLFKYFSQNTPSKIAILTVIITIGSFFVKILAYTRVKGYLSVFSISTDSVGYTSNLGVAEFLMNGIIFLGLGVAISFLYIVFESWFFNKKTYILLFFVSLFFIEIINFLLWMFMASGKSLSTYVTIEWFAPLFALTIIEIITAVIILRAQIAKKKKQEKRKKELIQLEKEMEKIQRNSKSFRNRPLIDIFTSSIVIIVFIYVASAYLAGAIAARQRKTFPIIEDSFAVVYQDENYYWAISSQEQNGNILLLKAFKQKIVKIDGIEVVIKGYDRVILDFE